MPASTPAEHLHARVIANPTAGRGRSAAALQEAVGVLASHGWTLSVRWTSRAGEAEDLARQAVAEGVEIVVAAGGDGTVNEVANGLVHSPTALGVLPLGTGNVLAAQLGLVATPTPLNRPNVVAAAHSLCSAATRSIDLGLAQPRTGAPRHFLLWAGIGFDAAITHELEHGGQPLKRQFGPFAYGAIGLRAVFEARGTWSRVRLDGRRSQLRILMAVVSNIALYAGAVELCPDARLDDGRLDVELFLGEDLRSAVRHVSSVLMQRRGPDAERIGATARQVQLVARQPLRVHLDAEPFGVTPIRITVVPGSLRLLVPSTAPERLFAAG